MTQGLVAVCYIASAVLFIQALGGLSHPESARRGNLYGIIGMTLALLATIIGVVSANYSILLGGLVVGGAVGLVAARRVQMTQMPELVAILHSLVGLAAVLVGIVIIVTEFASGVPQPSRGSPHAYAPPSVARGRPL